MINAWQLGPLCQRRSRPVAVCRCSWAAWALRKKARGLGPQRAGAGEFCRDLCALLLFGGVLLEEDALGAGVPEAALATLRAQAPLAAPAPRNAKDAEPGAQKRTEPAWHRVAQVVCAAVRHWPVLAEALKLQSLSTAGACFEEVSNLSMQARECKEHEGLFAHDCARFTALQVCSITSIHGGEERPAPAGVSEERGTVSWTFMHHQ